MKSKGVPKKLHEKVPARPDDGPRCIGLPPRASKHDLRAAEASSDSAFHLGSDWRFDIEMIDTWLLGQGRPGG
jgi:hypothetical protein